MPGCRQNSTTAATRRCFITCCTRSTSTDFNVRKVPQTEGLRQQRDHSLPPLEAWWCELLETGTLWGADPEEPTGRSATVISARSRSRPNPRYGGTNIQIRHVTQLGIYDQARQIEPRLKNYINDHRLGALSERDGLRQQQEGAAPPGLDVPAADGMPGRMGKALSRLEVAGPGITKWRAEEADDVVNAGSDDAEDTDDDDARGDQEARKAPLF